jgi:hypothetical protein
MIRSEMCGICLGCRIYRVCRLACVCHSTSRLQDLVCHITLRIGHKSLNPPRHTDRMNQERSKDPLDGVTLAMMLERLVATFGWPEMGHLIPIRCFTIDPSIKSSLTFLRKTPWARAKVEALYLARLDEIFPSEPTPSDSTDAG